jgi:cytochrome P450
VSNGNLAKILSQEHDAQSLREDEISFLTSNLIGGGVDTTASTTITFIFAMCAFPRVQKEAQRMLDKVLGKRCPTWSDEVDLPYIRACVEESLRWRTVTVLGGIPHAPIQDDVYQGYQIPKGTWITGNMWSIHRDPQCFPDPDEFKPERFLDRASQPDFPVKKGHSAFGWGRRQCSGQPLAEQGLFLTLACLLWAFDIQPGLGDDVGQD